MTADEVVEKIAALRRINRETGCMTRRAQSELLASLPDALLIEVAPKLQQLFETEPKGPSYAQQPRSNR
jgi:hypothetical protein